MADKDHPQPPKKEKETKGRRKDGMTGEWNNLVGRTAGMPGGILPCSTCPAKCFNYKNEISQTSSERDTSRRAL